uniref:Uncharacterized protein n=1 Tax=Daucus carota subsp. sativus TaxID=79200 RepID=A0A162A8U2_DAUCS
MEKITEGVEKMKIAAGDSPKKNRIQVSNTKKPLFFYVNLAKMEILLGKTANFDELMAAAAAERELAAGDGEEWEMVGNS